LSKFTYHGPFTLVTLRGSEESPLPNGQEEHEVQLRDGAEVELPEDHEYVATLRELGRLTPVADDAAAPAAPPSPPPPPPPPPPAGTQGQADGTGTDSTQNANADKAAGGKKTAKEG
jgi:hypothetical protein